jgi:hypothetical protein
MKGWKFLEHLQVQFPRRVSFLRTEGYGIPYRRLPHAIYVPASMNTALKCAQEIIYGQFRIQHYEELRLLCVIMVR